MRSDSPKTICRRDLFTDLAVVFVALSLTKCKRCSVTLIAGG
jgi:hypothetical protein